MSLRPGRTKSRQTRKPTRRKSVDALWYCGPNGKGNCPKVVPLLFQDDHVGQLPRLSSRAKLDTFFVASGKLGQYLPLKARKFRVE